MIGGRKTEYLRFAGSKDNSNSYCRLGNIGSSFLFNHCFLKLAYENCCINCAPSTDAWSRNGFLTTFIIIYIIVSTDIA